MTLPTDKHTRPLTRRQRLLPENWVPITYDSTRPIRIKAEPVPRVVREPNPNRDIAKEAAERLARVAKILKVPYEVWQQQIQEDEERFRQGTYVPPLTHRIIPPKKNPKRKRPAKLPVFAKKLNNKRPLYPDYSQFYGPLWKEVQAAAMARSKGKCEVCKRRKARHVHHVLPFRYFIDSQDAHFLENTLAVCVPCHQEEHRKIKLEMPLLDQLDYRWQ